MIVRWSRRAATQLFEAADYLERKRAGTGERLYAAVDRVVATIKEHPRAFAREPHESAIEVRRALVDRHGYWIIYRLDGDDVEILVLSFWSTRRRPQGWRRGR